MTALAPKRDLIIIGARSDRANIQRRPPERDSQMIMRQWRGRVPREKAEGYLTYLQVDGARGISQHLRHPRRFVTTRPVGKATEFLLVTFWSRRKPSAATRATTTRGPSTIPRTASSSSRARRRPTIISQVRGPRSTRRRARMTALPPSLRPLTTPGPIVASMRPAPR